jgi:hypothetical protein
MRVTSRQMPRSASRICGRAAAPDVQYDALKSGRLVDLSNNCFDFHGVSLVKVLAFVAAYTGLLWWQAA